MKNSTTGTNSNEYGNSTVLKVALLAMAFMAGYAGYAGNPNPSISPPNSQPYGKTYDEWSAAWWQWALSIPADINPLLDSTGANAGVGQSGDVWFLAGTFGGGPVSRAITVPAGKGLFFPIVNFVWVTSCPEEPQTASAIRPIVAPAADAAVDLACTVDGVPVANLSSYRTESPLFNVTLPDNNLFGAPGCTCTFGPSLDQGFYLMLAPLPPGHHTIHFHGALSAPIGPIQVASANPANH